MVVDVITESAVILLLILANGIFALAEIAVVTARRARLENEARRGRASARVALEMAREPDRFLSTIQVGITLIGILAGAFGGATIAGQLARAFEGMGVAAHWSAALGVGCVVLAITLLTVIVGELVPKRIGLAHPERIAMLVAPAMRRLSRLASPLVAFLTFFSDLILRVLRLPPAERHITEEEIQLMIEQGTREGVLDAAEKDILQRVFRLGDRCVQTLMTPRSDITWIDLNEPFEANWTKMLTSGHSWFPACDGHLSEVVGVIHIKWVQAKRAKGEQVPLRECAQQPLFVPEGMEALKLLEVFKGSHKHMAVVVDEFGTVVGLITPFDVLLAIVGEMPSTEGDEEPQAVRREDGSWLLDGLVPIDEVKELIHVHAFPGEEQGSYHTLGGFMMMQLGRIPRTADRFELVGHRFEVMDMDGRRVDKVLIAPLTKKTS
jgi:putative hemolysin